MKPFISAVVTAGLIFASVAAQAQEAMNKGLVHELRGGILAHDVDHLWSGFSRESGTDLNIEAIFTPHLNVLDGTLRPALGASLNTAGDTSKIYLGGRWQYDFENGLYASVGLGAAYHNGETRLVANDQKALGSSLLFHIPLEIGYYCDRHNALSVYFDHISNAYTQDENEGLDTLGLRYCYRF